ncbi:MAG: Hint domain-containing protein [Thermoguttaceae bacterium]|nr:Hint domain-containing protein [Thermoguttaceae bacterium]
MLYYQAIRRRTEFFFGSHRRAQESLRSQRLCRIVPFEERSLLSVFPAETANDSCNDMLQTSGSINSANLNTINEQATSAANTASATADAAQLARDAQNSVSAASGQADTDCVHEIGQASAQSIYDAAMAAANNTYTSSLMSSATSFLDATNASFETCSEYVSSLTCLYATAITAIDNGETIGNNYFSNPTEDAEVCFVAGTPILMADGTSKPIEEIRPGDMVLSVDHNDPEKDTPKPARVTRFFDNGLKSVVKLTFENQKTGEQFEVVCTPSHRYYVVGKCWTTAENLQPGDPCQSANDEPITILSRSNLDDPQHVYNFEVNEKHTYFVGKDQITSLLVHNACNFWGIVDSCLGGVQVAGEFIAGGADSLTFGITKLAREKVWGEELSKIHNPKVYLAGEITETVVEITVTAGSAALKKAAAKSIAKKASEIAAKLGTEVTPKIEQKAVKLLTQSIRKDARKIIGTEGKTVHHINPLLGHPPINNKRPYKFLPAIPTNTRTMFPTLGTPFANLKWNLQSLNHIDHLKSHQLAYCAELLVSKTVTAKLTFLRTCVNVATSELE